MFVTPKVGRLQTVADWHRQIGKIFRQVRKGRLPSQEGTRQTFIANVGAQVARYLEELRQNDELRAQVDAILAERNGNLPAIGHDPQEPV